MGPGLIGALQNERNLAVIEMYGLGGALELEASDTEEARRVTDEAAQQAVDACPVLHEQSFKCRGA